jgi:hypothetical protein
MKGMNDLSGCQLTYNLQGKRKKQDASPCFCCAATECFQYFVGEETEMKMGYGKR